MSARERAPLYSPELLGLAVRLADYPFHDAMQHHGTARSQICGSDIAMGLTTRPDGAIDSLGMRVSACAVGQAAAAIFAADAKGRNCPSVGNALRELEQWLAGEGEPPAWAGLDALGPALPHRGRHGAILLPWKAARAALCSGAAEG